MNHAWADFLASQTRSPGGTSLPAVFGDLPRFAVLRFKGPDAGVFLHGQLTCDVHALPADHWTWGAYCSAKGRVLATFILWQDADGYRMLLPQTLTTALTKRLRMFVLRSQVTIDDESEAIVLLGIRTGADESVLSILDFTEPHRAFALRRRGKLDALHLTDSRTLIVAPIEDAKQCWKALQGLIQIGSAAQWDQLSIAQGEPWVQPQTQDAFVPQMLNLELLNGVSFTKGCYPGQEIVARSQHLGQVKRRLYRFRTTATGSLGPGSPIFAAGDTSQPVGTVTCAAPAGDDSTEMLAVVQTAAQRAELHWGTPGGPTLELCPLPYAVPGTENG